MTAIRVGDFIASISQSALAAFADQAPWTMTHNAIDIISTLIAACGPDYAISGDIAVHDSARIEAGASLKGPALLGPGCFVASTGLIRGGCWLERDIIIGPSTELKTTFVFAGSKLAHLNFVGDSVLGARVNIEAGAMIANYRNERDDKRIRIGRGGAAIDTGVDKFGALVGDDSRLGANAVIAPGALLTARTVVPRLALIDQG